MRLYLFAYASFRFLIEFWRDDAVRGGFGPLSFSQWVSLCILMGLIVRACILRYRRKAV